MCPRRLWISLPFCASQIRTVRSWLPEATSLCGACSSVCPVGIPLHELLIELRQRGPASRGKRVFFGAWSRAWSRPSLYRWSSRLALFGRPLARLTPAGRRWGEGRELPQPARQTFHDWWAKTRMAP